MARQFDVPGLKALGLTPGDFAPHPSGIGDVVGPSSSADGNLAVFDGTTGKLLKDGGAPGGGGSFLSANTARVDASGNDGTGTVGDLTKPFLTVQGVINAFQQQQTSGLLTIGVTYAIVNYVDGDDFSNLGGANASGTQFTSTGTTPTVWTNGSLVQPVPGAIGCIDVGANRFTEDLTVTGLLPTVFVFKGAMSADDVSDVSEAFKNLAITDYGNDSHEIHFKDCGHGGSISTDSQLTLIYDCANGNHGSISSTYRHGTLTVGSIYGTGSTIGSITADDQGILIYGVTPATGSVISSANQGVNIQSCGVDQFSPNLFSVNAPNGNVFVNDSLLQDVTANTLNLVRSKIYGAITITTSPNPASYTDDQGPYAYDYDFTRDGGAQGTIVLTASTGSKGTGLPQNFVPTGAKLKVITPLDSASHLAHAALTTGESAGDLQAATLVSAPPWSSAGFTALTILEQMSAGQSPAIVITTEDLTAGKFTLHIEGYLSP